jgi:tetratricopeptide (TPR) repeat protein
VTSSPSSRWSWSTGAPITAHADRRSLSVRDRLALLALVCDAIDHAHTRGVVHRDLKPENVLVTTEGQPKVLDLGIAKLLDTEAEAETAVTKQGQIIGTLGYMSPEQVSGDPRAIDPRCDVYALGVLGYELLAGRRPLETTGMGMYEAIHHIRSTPPEPLTLARPGLDPDVSTIIGKAIAKDAHDRYESAARLADDLRRFLADEPILARPPSTLYQLSKFAKRNRVLVGSIAAVFLILLVSLVAVGASLRTARVAQRQAEADREVTQAVNAFLLEDLIAAADPRQGGARSVTLIDALNAASATLGDRFASAPDSEAAIRAALGEIYSTLNDFPRATENTRRALELTPDGDPGLRVDRLNALALLHMDLDEPGPAGEAIAHAERLLETSLQGDTLRVLVTRSNAGRLAYKTNDRERALELYQQVAEIGQREMPDDTVTISALGAVSLIYQQLGRLEEALPISERVVATDERLLGPEHPDTLTTRTNHAMLLSRLGRFDEAEDHFRRILEIRRRTMGDENVDTNVTRMVYAAMLIRAGRPGEAAPLAAEACARLDAVLGADHPYTRRACDTVQEARAAMDAP